MLRLTREQYEIFKVGLVRFYGEDWERLSRRQQRMWTCPVSVDSFSSPLFVSGLTSSILHRSAV